MSDYTSKSKPKMDVVSLVSRDICPKCHGELDTGWECTECGADWIEIATAQPPNPEFNKAMNSLGTPNVDRHST